MKKTSNLVGAQVRRLRNMRGWSQNQFAIKLQIKGMKNASRVKVSKIEARLITVKDDDVFYLAKVLGVPIPELYHQSLLNPESGYDEVEKIRNSPYGIP